MAGLETAGRHGTASWLATDRLEVASNQPGAAISERDGSNLGLGTTAPDYSTHRIEAALAGCGRRVGCAGDSRVCIRRVSASENGEGGGNVACNVRLGPHLQSLAVA